MHWVQHVCKRMPLGCLHTESREGETANYAARRGVLVLRRVRDGVPDAGRDAVQLAAAAEAALEKKRDRRSIPV